MPSKHYQKPSVALLGIICHSDFKNHCGTFRSQVAFIRDALEQYRDADIPHRDIAAALSCGRGSISKQLARLAGTPKPNGRPRLLPLDGYQMITELVIQGYRNRNPYTIDFRLDEIDRRFGVSMSADTMAHIVQRMPGVRLIDGIPMEKTRVMVDPKIVADFTEKMAAECSGVRKEFLVNMDETGCADFVDAREEKVLVPDEYPGITIPIPADRSVKRATLVAGIVADGKALKPLIIVPRKTVAQQISMMGYAAEQCIIVHQESGFITTRLFEQWIKEVLIPYIRTRRARTHYDGKAILILDGCNCHSLDLVRVELEGHKILLLMLPPHTSDQLQPLDLGIFGVFKLFYRKRVRLSTYERQSAQVIKMCDAWRRATTRRNVVNAFRAVGLVPVPGSDNGYYYLEFSPAAATHIRKFPEEHARIQERALSDPLSEDRLIGNRGRRRRKLD
jgi:hypothetical protein